MEKFGAMPAWSWPTSGVLLNLDVVLHERHYREPFKNSVPGGRPLRTTLQLFRIESERRKLPAPFYGSFDKIGSEEGERVRPVQDHALKAARELKAHFPKLQIKVYDAENKRSEGTEPAAAWSKQSTLSKPFGHSAKAW
jgi:hypothetical protein